MASYRKDPVTGQIIKVEDTTAIKPNVYTTGGYKPYGQTSVTSTQPIQTAPNLGVTQPQTYTQPKVSPTITQPPAISPQQQQIQTQIDETKAKIKELQSVQSLMGQGYDVKAPGETTAPTSESILSGLESRQGQGFQQYMDFLKGQPSALEQYQTFRTQLGLPQKEEMVTGIQTQVQKTEDLLSNLEQDINSRISGFSVTEPMRRRQLSVEQRPLREQYSQLLTGLGRAETGLTGGRQQLAEMIGLAQGEQERQAGLAKTAYEYGQKLTPEEETAQEIQKKQALAKAFPKAPTAPEKVGTPSTGVYERQTDGVWKQVIAPTKEPEKLTEAEQKLVEIPITENTLLKSRGEDGFVDPKIYLAERRKSRLSASDFDNRFSDLLSPQERVNLGIVKISGTNVNYEDF